VDESKSRQTYSPSLRLAWIILGGSFVVSLITSVTMILRTLNWIRLYGPTVPSTYYAVTQLSEWIFGLSSVGLLILVVVAILRSYRDH
jgi:hypothetical protein